MAKRRNEPNGRRKTRKIIILKTRSEEKVISFLSCRFWGHEKCAWNFLSSTLTERKTKWNETETWNRLLRSFKMSTNYPDKRSGHKMNSNNTIPFEFQRSTAFGDDSVKSFQPANNERTEFEINLFGRSVTREATATIKKTAHFSLFDNRKNGEDKICMKYITY